MNKPKRDILNLQRDKVKAILETAFSHSIMNNTNQSDPMEVLEERLNAHNVPYTWHDGAIRIVGHQRKPLPNKENG